MDPDLGLVRALVRREADVPVDAGWRTAEWFGFRDKKRANLLQPRSGVANEPQARFLHGVLVAFLALREPLFVVALRQVTEEPEEVRGEVFRLLGHLWPRLADIAAHRLNIGANGRASKTARTEPILSPRTRYHSQMNAVPAGCSSTYRTRDRRRRRRRTSSSARPARRYDAAFPMLPGTAPVGRMTRTDPRTKDRRACTFVPPQSRLSPVLSDTPSQFPSHSTFNHAPSATRAHLAMPRGSGHRARATKRSSPCPGRPRAAGRSAHPPARPSFAPHRGRRRARSSCSPGSPSPAPAGFRLARRRASGTRGSRPSGTSRTRSASRRPSPGNFGSRPDRYWKTQRRPSIRPRLIPFGSSSVPSSTPGRAK